jgi:hypothetical protein
MAETVFIGRHDERDRLASVLRGDSGSAGVAVIGDAGIGKSRLLAEVARASPMWPFWWIVLADVGILALWRDHRRLRPADRPNGRPGVVGLSRCAPFVTPQICALIPAMSAEAHFLRLLG